MSRDDDEKWMGRALDEARCHWLNPPEWVRQEPDVVASLPPRLVPVDEDAAKQLAAQIAESFPDLAPAGSGPASACRAAAAHSVISVASMRPAKVEVGGQDLLPRPGRREWPTVTSGGVPAGEDRRAGDDPHLGDPVTG